MKVQRTLPPDLKEFTDGTLRAIALNYIECKAPKPPKALERAVQQLKRRSDIVITKAEKGSLVVVMDRADYVRLLHDASIKDTSKFIPVSKERPKRKGRPPKYYHPLLEKKKQQLESAVQKILPKSIAAKICGSGSRLAHLYGLPKTHKENLSMRPILSATGTYNYALAKWLDEKLKPLSINRFTITDTFAFATEMKETKLNEEDILASFDVSSLFANVPLDETITILAKKAFTENWFNEIYDLNIKESDLVTLLQFATKDQLFQFEGNRPTNRRRGNGFSVGSPYG